MKKQKRLVNHVCAFVLGAGVATALGAFHTARAGTIIGIAPPSGPGLGSVSGNITTGSANNDDYQGAADQNPNQLSLEKRFENVAYIDVSFSVLDSDGTTEYWVTDTVTNSTTFHWHDFHIELGFGLGDNFVGSGELDFLDFDQPTPQNPAPTSDTFATAELTIDPDVQDYSNGKCKIGDICIMGFPIDIPDHTAIPDEYWIRDASSGDVTGYMFTLRQTPTIAEPATLLLFGIGLAGMATLRRRSAVI
jgi:hypothetical protein